MLTESHYLKDRQIHSLKHLRLLSSDHLSSHFSEDRRRRRSCRFSSKLVSTGSVSREKAKMKKAVLKLGLTEEKEKKKVMKIVSGIEGVESISMDMKDKKLTVIGDMDPVNLVSKLRKICSTEIVSVGPAKEEKKEDKKPEAKKDEGGSKKGDDGGKKKEDPIKVYPMPLPYYPPPPPPHFMPYHRSVEEDPNGCVIC